MSEFVIELTPGMLALIPITGAILQALKKIPQVQKVKVWMPFFAIGIAMGLSYATDALNPIMTAVIVGLVASGGYDLLKAPLK